MDYKAERQLREAERLLGVEQVEQVETETWTCRCGTSWLIEDKACADCGRWRPEQTTDSGLDEHTVKMINHMIIEARPAIEAKIKETDKWSGEIECPVCGKQLCYNKVKSNGHIHGKCETEGCLRWRE